MTLKDLFKLLIDFFGRERMDYAVVGAFALYAYGYTRSTRDVDFITKSEYQERIVGFLESLGFETLHCSTGFSNHLREGDAARIDIVYVDGETARTILGDARKKVVLDNLELPVVSPMHLIALKLFAIQNDPGRKFKELADIREIVKRTKPDKGMIQEYFRKYGQEDSFDETTNG